MTLGKLKTFFAPQTFNLFVIYFPAFHMQKCSYLAIAVTTISLSQFNHRQAQFFLIVFGAGPISEATAGYAY